MILAVDVHYHAEGSTTAGICFSEWDDPAPAASCTSRLATVADYTPGRFYERELPCILHLLREHALRPHLIVVDGYVYLDGCGKPGLGKYLYDALGGTVPVVGIAKTSFAGIDARYGVLRGDSVKPLYVTCVGMALATAQAHVGSMAGKHRLPTLLKLVDTLCRTG